MRKSIIFLFVMVAIVATIISCSKSGSTDNGSNNLDCTTVPKKFTDASPIFQTFCNQAACHDAGSINGPGPLTNYTQIFNARVAIRPAVASGLMPQNTTLNSAQKNTILCWIDSGAPNN